MIKGRAGMSARDQTVVDRVESLLRRHPGQAGAWPVTVLMGPRGSGKSKLLQRIYQDVYPGPSAVVDLGRFQTKSAAGAMAEIAFGLNESRHGVPRISFPSFALLAITLVADPVPNRVEELRQLAASGSTRLDLVSAELMQAARETPAVTGAFRLLPRRLTGRRRGSSRSVRDALPDEFAHALDQVYSHLAEPDRRDMTQLLLNALLTDVRSAYTNRWRPDGPCLVLLDNADGAAGREVLQALLEVPAEAQGAAPLVVVAAVTAYPYALRDSRVDEIEIHRLGDLTRSDVLAATRTAATGRNVDVHWLSWAVYELTRGQPAGTGLVLRALLDFDDSVPWDQRLRRILSPAHGLVEELLDRLLPHDRPLPRDGLFTDDLRPGALLRAASRLAAAPDLERASPGPVLDMLLLDEGADRSAWQTRALHPLLRLLLLRVLEDPDSVHARLRAEAADRGQEGRVAYHALAEGDLPTAAAYLDGLFERADPDVWCAEWCRLRRAPLRASEDDQPARERYEGYVRHLNDGTIAPRLRCITRLLAASWISPEPREAPYTGRVEDPYRDPLGDPLATLYPEIIDHLAALSQAHSNSRGMRRALYETAVQYDQAPWSGRASQTAEVARSEALAASAGGWRFASPRRSRIHSTALVWLAAFGGMLAVFALVSWLPRVHGWWWPATLVAVWAILTVAQLRWARPSGPAPPASGARVDPHPPRSRHRAFLDGVLTAWAWPGPYSPGPRAPASVEPPRREDSRAAVEASLRHLYDRLTRPSDDRREAP
ncbi:hypothetical protein ACIBKX_36780 [Streptomyces sp. NPDC050658]|uniref:hypothetical protein n=1 Tax=unclassified Streptomyces TaxID=2593676 RepID=UPI00341D08F0